METDPRGERTLSSPKERLAESGYGVVNELISEDLRARLLSCFEGEARSAGHRRGLEDEPVRELACVLLADPRITAHVGKNAGAVRAILFDKSPSANWPVAFHQDTTIAVRERVEMPGFTAWSLKDGVISVRPPASVLGSMLSVRVDLDGSDETNGALRVVPGSHKHGILERQAIERTIATCERFTCAVPRLGALLMRPLLVHGSRRSSSQGHRRVVHVEIAANALPVALRWATNLR